MSETVPVTATKKMLRIGTLSTIGRVDPREAADTISGMVLGQVYEAPYELAGGTNVRPRSWSRSAPRGSCSTRRPCARASASPTARR